MTMTNVCLQNLDIRFIQGFEGVLSAKDRHSREEDSPTIFSSFSSVTFRSTVVGSSVSLVLNAEAKAAHTSPIPWYDGVRVAM